MSVRFLSGVNVDSNTLFVDDANNRVGIGTASPAFKFNVVDNAATYVAQFKGNNSTYIISGDTSLSGESGLNARNSAGQLFLGIGSSGEAYFSGTSGATSLGFYLGGTNRIAVNSAGNVGIGTTSPSYKLDVATNLGVTFDATSYIRINKEGLGDIGITAPKIYSGLDTLGFQSNNATTSFNFAYGATSLMTIKGNGNVGIGTTSPSQKLDVAGNIKLSNNSYVSWRNAANNADIPLIQLSSGNEFNIGTTSSSVPATIKFNTNSAEGARLTSGGQFIVGGTTVGYAGTKLQVGNTSDSQNGLNILTSTTGYGYILFGDGANADTYVGQITYYHGDNSMRFQTNGGERMRIDASGNVGIGTNSPSQKLHVAGTVRISGTNDVDIYSDSTAVRFDLNSSVRGFQFENNNGTLVYVSGSGNVGIGTTSPSKKLDVIQSSDSSYAINIGNSVRYTYIGYSDTYQLDFGATGTNDNVRYGVFSAGGGVATFHTNGSERMRITNGGNVGIGDTTPSYKLDVNGDARITSHLYSNASMRAPIFYDIDDVTYYVNPAGATSAILAGNVGIGTTSPSGQLDVYTSAYQRFYVSYPSTYVTRLRIGAGAFIDQDAGNEVITIGQEYGGGDIAFNAGGNVERMRIFDSGTIKLNNYGSGTKTGTATQRLGVDASGNVIEIPIGSGAVDGSGTANYVTKWSDADTITNSQIFDDGSNVGIGTNDFGLSSFLNWSNLRLGKTANLFFHKSTNTFGFNVGRNFYFASDASYKYLTSDEAETIIFSGGNIDFNNATSGTEDASLTWNTRMRIDGSGNVGIGTTSPVQKLQVEGSIYSNGGNIYVNTGKGLYAVGELTLNSNNGSGYVEAVRISGAGNVGIGTTSPSKKIHVRDTASPYQISFQSDTSNVWNIGAGKAGYYQDWFLINSGSSDVIRINNSYTQITNALYSGTNFIIDTNGDAYQPTTGGVALWAATANATYPSYGFYGDTGLGMYRAAADTLSFATSDSERMRITSAGNVGIGTTSPTTTLDVRTDTGVLIKGASSATDGRIALVPASGGRQYGLRNYGSSFGIKDESADIIRMYFHYNGNTGIGTTNPNALLDVYTSQGGSTIAATHGTGGSYPKASGISFGATSTSLTVSNNGGNTTFTGGAGIYANNSASTNNPTDLVFWTTSAGSPTERLRITSAGNVGIGTTSPAHKLDISGDLNVNHTANVVAIRVGGIAAIGRGLNTDGTRINGGSTDGIEFTPNNDATIKVVIKPTGNVGIGTTSPGGKLTVVSDNAYSNGNGLRLQSSSGADRTLLYFSTDHTNQVSTIQSYRDGTGGGVKNLLINPQGGNVGIGTTSPGHRLDVGGSININNISYAYKINDLNVLSVSAAYTNLHHPEGGIAIYLGDSADRTNYYDNSAHRFRNAGGGSDYVFINSSGNVGIGTTSPTHKLHVAGSVNIEDDLTFGIGGFLGTSTSVFEMYSLGDIIYNADSNNNGDSSHIFRESGNELMRITSAGNVGIGTSSPDYKLNIVDNQASDYVGLFIANSRAYGTGQGAYGSSIWLGKEENGGNQPMGAITARPNSESNSTEGHMTFSTRASSVLNEHMRITNTGNVGIGTTSPTSGYKLDVIGAIRIENVNGLYIDAAYAYGDNSGGGISIYNRGTTRALRVLSSSGTGWGDILLNPYGAKVGIGTLDPTQALHVSGNIRVTGAYYDSNNSAGTSGQILKSTGTGTDWVTLSEITGVDGTGTANYIAKWSDTDTIANSQIRDDGTTVGIGQAPGAAKLSVLGSIAAGGKVTYKKAYSSGVDTTGVAVAGIPSSYNGDSILFEFTCSGGAGHYQKIVYSCWNAATVWYTKKVVDEGTNAFDVEASADAATITFTFKSRSGLQQYTPKIVVEANGTYDTSYL